MKLKSFNLEQLDLNNQEHKSMLISLFNDSDVLNTLGYMDILIDEYLDKKLNFYVLYKNDIKCYIGIILFISICDSLDIRYGILPNFRGFGYASILLKEVSDFLKENSDINTLSLFINPSNIASIKVALNSDFKKNGTVKYLKKLREF